MAVTLLGTKSSAWIFRVLFGILVLGILGQASSRDKNPVQSSEIYPDGQNQKISHSQLMEAFERGSVSFLESANFASFEAGNIGEIRKLGSDEYLVSLRSDNDDILPEFWRRWFFFRMENLPTDRPITLTIVGAGQWAHYVPVFYEGYRPLEETGWQHFPDSEVVKPDRLTLKIRHRFKTDKVYIARFVPYGLTNLKRFLGKIARNPHVSIHIAGYSAEQRPIPVISIGAKDSLSRPTVFIHARTHPGELGSSYLLEGFVHRLLDSRESSVMRLREHFRFEILPALNVDGVFWGNNRVTPGGINLEGKWYASPEDKCREKEPPRDESEGVLTQKGFGKEQKAQIDGCFELDSTRTPQEVLVWHRWIKSAVEGGAVPIMALNLHTSSVNPREGVFVFPHFGPRELGYLDTEAKLFQAQKKFFEMFSRRLGPSWFLPFPEDGGRYFLQKSLPETWWWNQFGSGVMALTIESTYGYVPGLRKWILPKDLRHMGMAMATALADYLKVHTVSWEGSPSGSLAADIKETK